MRKVIISLLMAALFLAVGCGGGGSDVDLDLSRMNPNMRYAEITQVTQEPEKYVGKTARLVGYFRPYPDGDKNGTFTKNRIALEMPDQAGCCAAVVGGVLFAVVAGVLFAVVAGVPLFAVVAGVPLLAVVAGVLAAGTVEPAASVTGAVTVAWVTGALVTSSF